MIRKKVFVCEDHPLFRQSLEALVADAEMLELVGVAEAASDAMEHLSAARPDIVLLDLNLKQGNGFEVLEHLRGHLPAVRTVVLTSYDDKVLANKARKAGAAAYVLKDTHPDDLLDVLLQLDSHAFYTSVATKKEATDFAADTEFKSILKLTRMEKKIVNQLINGASVTEMAAMFFISENTVKNHKKNIYRKLNVNRQSELILLCQRHGLLD